ncbi:response regulator transcription factor [Roseobacter sp. YSTF-M11]|uniref:Response regulator transcription factor n=1 Tax=Roseobacter insulae TaxID=2859783 RepID=A0A9X1K3M9_9RHOB|nr:response regulator transcription factor [Roseobacter insulae]MBW4709723.1 response regulator transcription factor [Roseobacter insulae]
MRIVLVEDNQSLRKGITYRLTDDGHAVDALDNGDDADQFLKQEDCDLVILDINLPGRDGLEVLADMRRRSDPRPVILLTARSTTQERVAGLDAGADDYLVKPFEMDELAARVRALARRKDVAPRRTVDLGQLTLDVEAPQLLHRGEAVEVPRRELSLLVALAQAGGTPVAKETLLDKVYGVGSGTDDKVVEVYVSRLRKRLARYDVSIRVHRGIGYALIASS